MCQIDSAGSVGLAGRRTAAHDVCGRTSGWEVGSGAMRILIVLALSVPLAGCFSLTAQNTIPEWAMQAPSDAAVELAARPPRAAAAPTEPVRVARQSTGMATDAPINVRPAGLTHSVARKKPTALAPDNSDVTAFSAEWQAREDA